jgi:hypothetical protein
MKTFIYTLLLAVSLAVSAMAQGNNSVTPQQAASAPGHEPPAQAYTDCKGKKAGDSVEHTTREGKVAATCELSTKGLVARPKQAKPDAGTPPTK